MAGLGGGGGGGHDGAAMQPHAKVAVFDLDGTITRADTLRLFLRARRRRLPARPWALARLPAAWWRARRDVAARGAVKAALLDFLVGGRPKSVLEREAESFAAAVLAHQVKPAARAAIERHRSAGHVLLLASASPALWVEPIGRALGFDAVIATRLLWRDGRFAGRLDGPNLLNAAKREAVLSWLARAAGGAAPVAAYTDHHHDLPLLLLAEHPVAVDPTPALAAEARARGIPIAHWKDFSP